MYLERRAESQIGSKLAIVWKIFGGRVNFRRNIFKNKTQKAQKIKNFLPPYLNCDDFKNFDDLRAR